MLTQRPRFESPTRHDNLYGLMYGHNCASNNSSPAILSLPTESIQPNSTHLAVTPSQLAMVIKSEYSNSSELHRRAAPGIRRQHHRSVGGPNTGRNPGGRQTKKKSLPNKTQKLSSFHLINSLLEDETKLSFENKNYNPPCICLS